jgi:hypothetical protein
MNLTKKQAIDALMNTNTTNVKTSETIERVVCALSASDYDVLDLTSLIQTIIDEIESE